MAFLWPYFEHDVFVSYSHGAREGETDAPLKDWTLRLIRRLERDTRAVDTEFDDLAIWCDEQIDPTIHLTDELRNKVSRSGILIIVMSERYLASTWCKQELNWFRQQVQDRARDQGRVFVVRALPTKESNWPDFLRDEGGHGLGGFRFHDSRDEMPYGWRGSGENSEDYVRPLWRLRRALISRLRELRVNSKCRAKSEAPGAVATTARTGDAPLREDARPKHPYPGLRPFEVNEWSIFLGREQMIDDVIERLTAHRLVLIHGSSGSGKSSLVRAGVLPKLAQQHLRAGTPWRTCGIRPSGGPLWNLANELARLEGGAGDMQRIDAFMRAFNRRDATLSSVVGSLTDLKTQRLCILVDEFEELFRFEKETSREEAELFVDLLVRSDADKASEIGGKGDAQSLDKGSVHVIVTMRSEFLGECARFTGLAEAINRTQYLVPRASASDPPPGAALRRRSEPRARGAADRRRVWARGRVTADPTRADVHVE
jgi:hypothetical protein